MPRPDSKDISLIEERLNLSESWDIRRQLIMTAIVKDKYKLYQKERNMMKIFSSECLTVGDEEVEIIEEGEIDWKATDQETFDIPALMCEDELDLYQ